MTEMVFATDLIMGPLEKAHVSEWISCLVSRHLRWLALQYLMSARGVLCRNIIQTVCIYHENSYA